MAKKKAAKKKAGKKKAAAKKKVVRHATKAVGKKKRPAKKAVAKKIVSQATRPKRAGKKASLAKQGKAPAGKRKAASKASPPPAPALQPNQYRDQMSVTIEGPDKSGNIVATESLGGDIRVHHTVHPGETTTPIPGQSYRDLKKLGEGTHEIDVVRSIAPPPGVTSSAPAE
jgi:hypothetical protein